MNGRRTIKVLQVIDTLGMGGAETWLMEVLRHWSKNGHGQMDFLITSGNRGIFDDEARRLGTQIHYIRYRRAHLPRFIKEFRCLLRKGQYQAIHDHQDYASGWHFLMGGNSLPQVRITHVHNPRYQLDHNYGISLLRRMTAIVGRHLVARYATVAAGTSWQILQEYGFFEYPVRRLPKEVVHCGFDLRRFARDVGVAHTEVCAEFGWPEGTPIVLFAGRLDASLSFHHPRNHKNSAFATAVFQECLRLEPRLHMLMAGANEHVHEVFDRHLKERGLATNVRLLGVRHDIERLMLASRVLLFPSRAEGLGMVAVEAQAAGLPVVASTAVPRECLVIPEIITFLNIHEPLAHWAAAITARLHQARPAPTVADLRWSRSAFNIHISASRLVELYSTGRAGDVSMLAAGSA